MFDDFQCWPALLTELLWWVSCLGGLDRKVCSLRLNCFKKIVINIYSSISCPGNISQYLAYLGGSTKLPKIHQPTDDGLLAPQVWILPTTYAVQWFVSGCPTHRCALAWKMLVVKDGRNLANLLIWYIVFFHYLQGFTMDPRSGGCRMSSINSMLMVCLLDKSGLPSILCEILVSWKSRSNPEILGFGRWVCAFPTGSLPAYMRLFVKSGGKLLFQWGPNTPWSSTPSFWGVTTQNLEGGFKDLGHLVVIIYHLTLPETGQKHSRSSVSVTFHRQKQEQCIPFLP